MGLMAVTHNIIILGPIKLFYRVGQGSFGRHFLLGLSPNPIKPRSVMNYCNLYSPGSSHTTAAGVASISSCSFSVNAVKKSNPV